MAGNRTQKISCCWEECWNHASQKELVLWWWLESNPEGNLLLWEWQETNPKCKLLLCWWRKSNLEGKLLFCEDAGNVPRKVLPLSRMTGVEPGRKAAVPNISSYTVAKLWPQLTLIHLHMYCMMQAYCLLFPQVVVAVGVIWWQGAVAVAWGWANVVVWEPKTIIPAHPSSSTIGREGLITSQLVQNYA